MLHANQSTQHFDRSARWQEFAIRLAPIEQRFLLHTECPSRLGRRESARDKERSQPIIFLLHHGVALARAPFEPRPVEHSDAAASIIDEPGLMQIPGCLGNAFSSHPEHVGNQFLGHHELTGIQSVEAEQ